MRVFRWVVIVILVFAVEASAQPQNSQSFSFTAVEGGKQYTVRLEATPLPSYEGKPLLFYRGSQPVCLLQVQVCPKEFVGSATIVKISITDHRGRPAKLVLRESVVQIAKTMELESRDRFERSVKSDSGVVTDIQVFGVSLDGESAENRASLRASLREAVELIQQDLFLGNSQRPFASLSWRRSARQSQIVEAKSLPESAVIASR